MLHSHYYPTGSLLDLLSRILKNPIPICRRSSPSPSPTCKNPCECVDGDPSEAEFQQGFRLTRLADGFPLIIKPRRLNDGNYG